MTSFGMVSMGLNGFSEFFPSFYCVLMGSLGVSSYRVFRGFV